MKLLDNWTLSFVQDSSFNGDISNVKTFEHFDNVKIPTLFELEIYKNKLLGHPYESTNIWDYQRYEDYHQFYVTKFKSNKREQFLKIHGIDTISEIYVNGELVGKTDNMFISYTFKLNNLLEENELLIHILPSVVEGRKYDNHKWYAAKYNYESLYIRKSPSSFGWDILPRTPLGGIYKEIEIVDSLSVLKDVHIVAEEIYKKYAILKFNLAFRDNKPYRYVIEGRCGSSQFYLSNCDTIRIQKPKLWTIRGYGEQNLYLIKISVYLNDELIETKNMKYGIRKVELKRTSLVQENGCFEFYINNEKVFLLGSNWVPIEAIKHIDDERMLKALDMITDLGCNSLRVWGGGTYESDLFYEKCDELGIFVWQDFMMGCAVYPQDKLFQNKLKEEVEFVVKRLRNHCSICLWAGDNENDLAGSYWSRGLLPANKNVLTRKLIPSLLKKLDLSRPYLPSSPFIDKKAEKNPGAPLSEDHLWGPRDYFKGEFYSNAKPYFTSETGYHALNSVESLKKFINKPWPLFVDPNVKRIEGSRLIDDSNKPTKEYLCHGTSIMDDYDSPYEYRTRLMANQVYTLFTNEIDSLEDFVMASQISQAEAMKYFIERMRKDYDRNGGIIWWNIIDGWPQVSDAVVDYYFSKKIAYNYIKRSQIPTFLMINEDLDGLNLYCVSSEKDVQKLSYEIIDGYTNKTIDKGVVVTKPRSSFVVKKIPDVGKTLLVIKYQNETGEEFINHFHTKIIDIDLFAYANAMKKYKLL